MHLEFRIELNDNLRDNALDMLNGSDVESEEKEEIIGGC